MELASPKQPPKTIFLLSTSATNVNSTMNSLNFNLPSPILRSEEDLVFIALSKFQSFNSFPTISASKRNNRIIICNVLYNAVTGLYYNQLKEIVIPDGSYNRDSLFTYLNPLMNYTLDVTGEQASTSWTNSAGSSILSLGFGSNITNDFGTFLSAALTTASPDVGKTALNLDLSNNLYEKTYSNSSLDQYIQIGVYLVANDNTIGFLDDAGLVQKFGLPDLIPNGDGLKGVGVLISTKSFTGPDVYDFSGSHNIYFVVQEMGIGSISNSPEFNSKNIVGTALINGGYQSQINYTQNNENYQAVQTMGGSLNSLSVFLYDESGHLLDFRGLPWSMEIQLKTLTNVFLDQIDKTTANMNTTIGPYNTSTAPHGDLKSNPYGGVSYRQGFFQNKRGRLE